MTPSDSTPTGSQQDLWILEHQILPNIYGLKHAALSRVIERLKAEAPTPPQESPAMSTDSLRRYKVVAVPKDDGSLDCRIWFEQTKNGAWVTYQDAQAELAALRSEVSRLTTELEKARDDAEYWLLVADGVKHSHRCPKSALCSDTDREHMAPCFRCQTETLEAEVSRLRAQIRELYNAELDGGVCRRCNGDFDKHHRKCVVGKLYEILKLATDQESQG